MTERWRKKLSDLDATGPTEHVYERAKQGPTRQDDHPRAPGASTRVVTGVVAFAVFALALSFFAIPAFRMHDVSGGGTLSSSLVTAASAPPSGSVSTDWTTYTDPLGWTVDVPPGWTTQVWPEAGAGFAGDGITVEITRGGAALSHDDSSYPLEPDGFLFQGEGGLIGKFYGDGLPFGFVVLEDQTTLPGMTPERQSTVDRMISSISFQPWHVSHDERHGLIAVGKVLPAATAQWIEWGGQHYVAYDDGDGGRALLGPVQACAEQKFEIRMTGQAGITCADGTSADWSFSTGEPAPGNGPNWDFPLAKRPAVLSWDGYLLVRMTQVGS